MWEVGLRFSRGQCMGSDSQSPIHNHCLSLILICMETCLFFFSLPSKQLTVTNSDNSSQHTAYTYITLLLSFFFFWGKKSRKFHLHFINFSKKKTGFIPEKMICCKLSCSNFYKKCKYVNALNRPLFRLIFKWELSCQDWIFRQMTTWHVSILQELLQLSLQQIFALIHGCG